MKTNSHAPALYAIKHQSFIAFFLCLIVMPQAVIAQTIEAKLPKRLTVTANYHSGAPDKPAILLLHGFLQTNQAMPLSSIESSLAAKGYTTLAPTLSLGIHKRSQSMSCEAVHTNLAEDDVAEITYWLNFLNKKSQKNIVVIGFSSTGNIEALMYSLQQPLPAVKNLILASLTPMYTDAAELRNARTVPTNARKPDLFKPEIFSLGYCKKNFAATKRSYLSYAQFDESRVLDMVKKSPLSIDIIFGSNDNILPDNWKRKVESLKSPAKVRSIENANHFFDGISEFDLTQEIEDILKDIPAL